MSNWAPTAKPKNLQLRAQMLYQLRDFFKQRNVLEVETPLVCSNTVTDPNIESLSIDLMPTRYLQTSPEYAMKRLLVAGLPDIYQICKCFRQEEHSKQHNPEFTMIEWYRKSYTLTQIMSETVELVELVTHSFQQPRRVEYISYTDMYKKYLGVSFFDLCDEDITRVCEQHGLHAESAISHASKIDFIFSQVICAQLEPDVITCVFHYPAEQAALARLNPDDPSVAERFEIFCGGLELANGYVELADVSLLQLRFENDVEVRHKTKQTKIAIDQKFLEAHKEGLPQCAGVAVGLDRLLMLALNADTIEEVMSFSWNNA